MQLSTMQLSFIVLEAATLIGVPLVVFFCLKQVVDDVRRERAGKSEKTTSDILNEIQREFTKAQNVLDAQRVRREFERAAHESFEVIQAQYEDTASPPRFIVGSRRIYPGSRPRARQQPQEATTREPWRQ